MTALLTRKDGGHFAINGSRATPDGSLQMQEQCK